MDLDVTIGLETHIQLKTRTKLFCACRNEFGAPPNSLVCPVCSGLPGVLPVLNRSALEIGIRAALALGCEVASFTKFDRKNYFYPDLPKGYQISQYDLPLSRKGRVTLADGTAIRIHRIHLEEDAGKGIHDRGDFSLVDLNRAGVPLLECVSEPDLRTPEQAVEYLTTLKQTMQYVGASECDMEKGSLRCDVNVSVAPKGSGKLGTKVEVKNLNSFRHVAKALEYEVHRQGAALAHGEKIVQETRLWREADGVTASMRSKEEAHDYRYFPEPDLPPFTISRELVESLRKSLPELPGARRERFVKKYGLSEDDAKLYTQDLALANFYEGWAEQNPGSRSNWWPSLILQRRNELNATTEEILKNISFTAVTTVTTATESGQINVKSGREIFLKMLETGEDPKEFIKGSEQISDEAGLEKLCREAMAAVPRAVEQFREGKEKALDSLVGKVMGATKGRANPKIVQETLRRLIGRA